VLTHHVKRRPMHLRKMLSRRVARDDKHNQVGHNGGRINKPIKSCLDLIFLSFCYSTHPRGIKNIYADELPDVISSKQASTLMVHACMRRAYGRRR